MEFKLGELFCGPGGIALGAKNSCCVASNGEHFSIVHAWANDYDKDTCDTYHNNICPKSKNTVVCEDVRKLKPEAMAKISSIDGLAFGFPCNDFSLVGEQKGMDGIYGPLYSYGIKMLNHFQPMFFVAENVGGLNSANDGNALNTILDELHGAGYTVVAHLYKFEEYGVPQARHRIIIVGIRSDLDIIFQVPTPLGLPYKTAQDAIETPPIPEDSFNNELTRQSQQVIDRLKHIKPGQNAFTADLPEHLRLNVKNVTMSQIYRRLDPNKPAYTITGSGGGGTHVYHWKEDRALTNRERARLQTFPDNYAFSGSKESVRKQIGMAVPPDGAQVVFEAILKSFAGIPYPHRLPNIAPRIAGEFKTKPAPKPTQMTLFEKQATYNVK
jgi:DNA (cytosine-5)-methyltransferase 1